MHTAPSEGDRVTVPFNVGGATEDARGTVTGVRTPGSKTIVKIKLDGHGQEEVEYPLDAVEPLTESQPDPDASGTSG